MIPGSSSGLSRKNCIVAGAIAAISTFSWTLFAFADPPTNASTTTEHRATSEEAQNLLKSISNLVKEYFPKAKITSTENSLHFEYKVHERMHPYNRRNVLSPDLDGILGDLEVKSGGPKDRIVGFLERPETVHSVLLMAPYSASDKTWLSTRLVFQPITPLDFMDTFKNLISSYDHPGDSPESSSTADSQSKSPSQPTPTPETTVTAVKETASPPESVLPSTDARLSNLQGLDGKENSTVANSDLQKNISKETNPVSAPETSRTNDGTSSPPMDKYTYPEGRFKVMLPGSPQVKYTDQAGMRMVDYLYVVPEGTFNVSYVILPEPPANLKTSQLLDNMSQSVVNSLKGLHTRQYPSTLQGFPGCQLEMPELANKPGQSARFRIYIVQKFIYIVGLTGKKDWLNSSNAKEFLDTFQINIEPSEAQKALQRRQDAEREQRESAARQSLLQKNSRTQGQKDYERSRADWEFNRRR